jgi:hypothetical protein
MKREREGVGCKKEKKVTKLCVEQKNELVVFSLSTHN